MSIRRHSVTKEYTIESSLYPCPALEPDREHGILRDINYLGMVKFMPYKCCSSSAYHIISHKTSYVVTHYSFMPHQCSSGYCSDHLISPAFHFCHVVIPVSGYICRYVLSQIHEPSTFCINRHTV